MLILYSSRCGAPTTREVTDVNRFTNKNVLLTGAASGIGRATAQRLVEEGAHVFCVDMNLDGLKETAAGSYQISGVMDIFVGDISTLDGVHAIIDEAAHVMGRIDCLVNIAGVMKMEPFEKSTDETWMRMININLTGTYWMCRECMPHLLESKGNIVNVASIGAISGLPYTAAYGASKAGVLALTKSIAIEMAAKGVRANTVSPGGIHTPLASKQKLPDGFDYAYLPRFSGKLGRGEPEDVAGVIALLASDRDGKFITGCDYTVDGGTVF